MKTVITYIAATLCFFASECVSVPTLQAQTYEGYLVNETDRSKYPIWLEAQSSGATYTGSYFYKRVGSPIQLEGSTSDKNLVLKEIDSKGKISGTFTITTGALPVTGLWKDALGKKSLKIELYPVDPSYRTMAVIPKPEALILADGTTFMDNIKANSEMMESRKKGQLIKPGYLFARRGLATLLLEWESLGAYQEYHKNGYIFDCQSLKQIMISNEISKERANDFNALIAPKIASQLAEHWTSLDAEGRDVIRQQFEIDANATPKFDEMAVKSERFFNEAVLTEDGLVIMTNGFYELPHFAQAYDCVVEVTIPYKDLATYLVSSSPLMRLKDL
jgi:hypothetical protein